jgi:hypothetical protein
MKRTENYNDVSLQKPHVDRKHDSKQWQQSEWFRQTVMSNGMVSLALHIFTALQTQEIVTNFCFFSNSSTREMTRAGAVLNHHNQVLETPES